MTSNSECSEALFWINMAIADINILLIHGIDCEHFFYFDSLLRHVNKSGRSLKGEICQ